MCHQTFVIQKSCKWLCITHDRGSKVVFPIRLRSVNYQDLSIGAIQGMPEKKWLVTDFNKDERDGKWTEIAKEIQRIAYSLKAKKMNFDE